MDCHARHRVGISLSVFLYAGFAFTVVTEVNGVTFYALIDDGDMIKGGRIV